ncbi:OLC1v1037891C1 [Oldenlandia corymbosa var. corymbosa]|uniref:OLC1v1037891C1 n=1 Tax=Oldenlandia corymbosa var. corymbosa TaxID=529605 RepID=A0AAV1CZ57_OLDCO|nr:OLC1v1037891C1 [Oldenlandia corymbosa var. corymbosa]
MVKKEKPFRMASRRKEQSDSSTSVLPPPWTELPVDITANILQRLSVEEILENAQKVCTTWRSVSKDPAMWRKIDMSQEKDRAAWVMCKQVVNRSQGQLIDLKIGFFCDDDLLAYISQRSSQLRCLLIVSCVADYISDNALAEAAKRFPLLEELHLFHSLVSSKSLEIIGRSCPLLKSFSLGGAAPFYAKDDFMVVEPECNAEALAIAKTMPGLRHLSLFGNTMSNVGLLAILEGCIHLESLDLRRCFRVNLEGDISKQCSQKLKSLKQPDDSIADLEHHDSDSFDIKYADYFGGYCPGCGLTSDDDD